MLEPSEDFVDTILHLALLVAPSHCSLNFAGCREMEVVEGGRYQELRFANRGMALAREVDLVEGDILAREEVQAEVHIGVRYGSEEGLKAARTPVGFDGMEEDLQEVHIRCFGAFWQSDSKSSFASLMRLGES